MDIQKLMHGSIHKSIQWNQYGVVKPWDIYEVTKSSKSFIQRLKRWSVLEGHTGCVNTLAWNMSGYLLLTGSDDYLLNLYDIYSEKLLHSIESGHHANIFSAKFLPCTSDMKIVSCSGDGMLHFNELGTHYGQNHFNCHSGTTYEVLVTPGDPNTFLSCGEDGTVRMFDLRTKTKCHCQECSEDILIDCRHAVTSISINPLAPYELGAGCKDSYVRVFDRRTLGTSVDTRSVNRNRGWMPGLFCRFKPEKLKKDTSCRVTSLQYSNDGNDLLVSYCTDYVYSFTVKDNKGTVMNLKQDKDKSMERNGASNGYNSEGTEELPPVKRLRLRGDWSDTGPQARPETEDENTPENTLMQRMSELFTRWLEDAMYSNERRTSNESSQSDESATQAHSLSNANTRHNSGGDISSFDQRVGDPNEGDHSSQNNIESSLDSVDENWMLHDSDHDNEFIDEPVALVGAESVYSLNEAQPQFVQEELKDETASASEDVFVSQKTVPERNINKTVLSSSHHNHIVNDVKAGACGGPGSVNENTLLLQDNSTSHIFHSTNTATLHCNVESNHELAENLFGAEVERNNESTDDTAQLLVEQSATVASDVHLVEEREIESRRMDRDAHLVEEREIESRRMDRDAHLVEERDAHLVEEREIECRRLDRDVAAMRIQSFLRSYKNRRAAYESNDGMPDRIYVPNTAMVYKGHRNSRTMIKEANFWGDHFILSGSDCGRIFIWDRRTGELIMSLQGDRHVVNCVQPHPYDPILATSGIDRDIKIWAPLAEQEADISELSEIVNRNERMLEESRDTITVPASFVLRMLASFGSIRNRRSGRHQGDEEELASARDDTEEDEI